MQSLLSIFVLLLAIMPIIYGSFQFLSGEVAGDDDKPICYSREPCQLAMLSRQAGKVAYRKFPTWCKCDDRMICASSHYDTVKRASIHKCQTPEEVRKGEEKKAAESTVMLKYLGGWPEIERSEETRHLISRLSEFGV